MSDSSRAQQGHELIAGSYAQLLVNVMHVSANRALGNEQRPRHMGRGMAFHHMSQDFPFAFGQGELRGNSTHRILPLHLGLCRLVFG